MIIEKFLHIAVSFIHITHGLLWGYRRSWCRSFYYIALCFNRFCYL